MNPWGINLKFRRSVFLSLTAILTGLFFFLFYRSVRPTGLDAIDIIATGVFLLLFSSGVFNLLLYVFGFGLSFFPDPANRTESKKITTRTAYVMPIFNEDVERVGLGVLANWRSAKASGLVEHCDYFVLSDSDDPAIKQAEEEMIRQLESEFEHDDSSSGRLFLIRRAKREKFKAGNISNFLELHGANYDFMLVLDADSLMTGDTVKRLILRMQESPKLGILQSVVLPARSRTIFARAMQFTISRSMPLFARGVYWFLGSESVYWGHNALIRIEPFMEHCNVPEMPGKPPRGGTIMSQDIVEAALMGRAGWKVEWDVDSTGSYDEMPANILTYGKRDRRWCQGNFQHFWLIFGEGARFGHRLYFANGILAYTSGPLLLSLMTFGLVQGLRGRVYEYQQGLLWLFLVPFLIMLLTPKVMGILDTIRKRQFGMAEGLSFALEIPFSMLIAPMLFYLHTTFVLGILLGKVTPWINQSRNPREYLPWRTATKMFWLPGLGAVLLTVLASRLVPSLLIYLLAVVVGWVIAIPLATGSSLLLRWRSFWPDRMPTRDLELVAHFPVNKVHASRSTHISSSANELIVRLKN